MHSDAPQHIVDNENAHDEIGNESRNVSMDRNDKFNRESTFWHEEGGSLAKRDAAVRLGGLIASWEYNRKGGVFQERTFQESYLECTK